MYPWPPEWDGSANLVKASSAFDQRTQLLPQYQLRRMLVRSAGLVCYCEPGGLGHSLNIHTVGRRKKEKYLVGFMSHDFDTVLGANSKGFSAYPVCA
jgi:hypothetical protein